MKTNRIPVALACLTLLAGVTVGCGDDGAGRASATFETPGDGESLAGGVPLAMSAEGITIEPAGDVVPGAGHFHVIADAGCAATGEAIAKDADHVHFGSGADRGTIYLEPGTHSLCLQVGNGAHAALDATDEVEVEVGIASGEQWCQVIDEADEMLDVLDISEDEFAVKQVGYENVRRLFAQLADAEQFVDEAVRPGVTQLIGWGSLMTETIVAADSEEQAIEQLYESPDSPFAEARPDASAAAWISDTCGVAVDA